MTKSNITVIPDLDEEIVFWTKNELELLKEKINSFSAFQRYSSTILWIAILMTILHILADIYFHVF